MAQRFVAWGLLNLLAAGPGLGLLAAFDAATDGSLALQYPIFGTHAWMTMMGWAVPTMFALVCLLLPVLKDVPFQSNTAAGICLFLLIVSTLGLAAYLFLAHTGRSALFILPPIWAFYLICGIIYNIIVWRHTARSLRPTATDIGVQSGAVWLLIVLSVKVIAALGGFGTGRHDFLASSDAAVLIAMMFGFLGNTGLAVAGAVAPAFLLTPHPRAKVLNAFTFYNVMVAIWCLGAAWVLPWPFSFGRLFLALAGLLLLTAVIRILIEMRLFELVSYRANSRRRKLTRLALATGTIMFTFSAAVISLIGIWNAATMSYAPAEMITLPMHFFMIGFFSNLVIALFVPLLGARSLSGAKLVFAYLAYVMFLLWLVAKLALAVMGIVSHETLWYPRYIVGGLAAAAAVSLALWMFSAIVFPGRSATPQATVPPPAQDAPPPLMQ
ncbi:MAG: hypothetical protein ABFE07_00255 [Armatimonadia bacterium]